MEAAIHTQATCKLVKVSCLLIQALPRKAGVGACAQLPIGNSSFKKAGCLWCPDCKKLK